MGNGGDNFDGLDIAVDVDFNPILKSFANFRKNMDQVMKRGGGNQVTAFSQMLFAPNSANATKKFFDNSFGSAIKSMSEMMKAVQGNPALKKGMGEGFFKNALVEVKELKRQMPGLKKELGALAKDIKIADRGSFNRGARKVAGGLFGRKSLGQAGRLGLRAGGFLASSAIGFVTGAYKQGVQAYEQIAAERLAGAPAMMEMNGSPNPGAKGWGKRYGYNTAGYDTRGAQRMGYNAAEGARIQAQAATAGIGGKGASGAAFQLSRALGSPGVEWGGGFMRMQGMKGASGTKTMMRQVSQSMAIGVKTGLDEARLPELMNAQLQYAEQQLAATPDDNQWKNYIQEMGMVQLKGGPGMQGKYGAAAMGQADQAIKGAQGVQQSFLLRAFGFGKGTSFMGALQRQEKGAFGEGPNGESNMMAIMKQLRGEYGAGKGGGLSEEGLLAFKGMGFGTTHMGKKFSDIYLQQQRGELTPEQAKSKVKGIQAAEAESKMPAIQRKAYSAMAAWGGVAKTLAGQFNSLANFASKNYSLKTDLIDMQKKILAKIKLDGVKDMMKNFTLIATTLLPNVVAVLNKILKWISFLAEASVRFYSDSENWGKESFLDKLNTMNDNKVRKDNASIQNRIVTEAYKKYHRTDTINAEDRYSQMNGRDLTRYKVAAQEDLKNLRNELLSAKSTADAERIARGIVDSRATIEVIVKLQRGIRAKINKKTGGKK